jgi:hypothetical protein
MVTGLTKAGILDVSFMYSPIQPNDTAGPNYDFHQVTYVPGPDGSAPYDKLGTVDRYWVYKKEDGPDGGDYWSIETKTNSDSSVTTYTAGWGVHSGSYPYSQYLTLPAAGGDPFTLVFEVYNSSNTVIATTEVICNDVPSNMYTPNYGIPPSSSNLQRSQQNSVERSVRSIESVEEIGVDKGAKKVKKIREKKN